MICPMCGNCELNNVTTSLLTKFEGVMIEVPDAKFRECPGCNEKFYSASELKRWKEIKQERY